MRSASPSSNPEILLDYCFSHVPDPHVDVDPETEEFLRTILLEFIGGKKEFEEVSSVFVEKMMTDAPVQIARDIMNVSDTPLEDAEGVPENDEEQALRRKSRTWTSYEDQRLVAGIFRFGFDSWIRVANFVGGGRTRAQCAQRWTRGVNPKICKKGWTLEEDTQLLNYVRIYGNKSWAKIANLMGNRSDVQCRYHYTQLTSDIKPSEGYIPLGRGMRQITSSGFLPSGLLNPMFPNSMITVSSLTQFPSHLLNDSESSPNPIVPTMQPQIEISPIQHNNIHCWDFEKNEPGSLDTFLQQMGGGKLR